MGKSILEGQSSAREQCSVLARWNLRLSLGFPIEEIAPPWCKNPFYRECEGATEAETAVLYLPDQGNVSGFRRTLLFYLERIRDILGSDHSVHFFRPYSYTKAMEKFEFVNLDPAAYQPGLRWESVTLDDPHAPARDLVIDQPIVLHIGILAAVAMHAEWFRRSGRTLTGLNLALPGCRVMLDRQPISAHLYIGPAFRSVTRVVVFP